MIIDLPPPPPPREPPRSANTRLPRPRGEHPSASTTPRRGRSVATLLTSLSAALLACGGSSADAPIQVDGCNSSAECAGGQECVDGACVAPGPVPSTSAGFFACSVVQCPPSQPSCCASVEASATGNQSQGYASRNEMVVSASAYPGEVRADFMFDAPDQQGWVTFHFQDELDLSRLDFTGRHEGVADRFLAVNTNRSDDTGCAFSFQLEFRPSPSGPGPFVRGNAITFNDNDFCYGTSRPRPGRARALAFAIFSMRPGEASLVISNLRLRE